MVLYHYFDDLNLVVSVHTGELTDDQLQTFAADLSADRRLRPGYRELADTRGVTSTGGLTADGLRQVAALESQFRRPPGGRMAAVVTGPVSFGLARLYSVHAETTRREVRVCREMGDAFAWLGLDRAQDLIRGVLEA
jgi:hypothetical protein